MDKNLTEQIDAILPQTQCRKCGYPGCLPYAEAMSAKQADINLCPPGGEAVVRQLADLLNTSPKPLVQYPRHPDARLVAVINEAACIGCTKCIPPCPVDAIIGAAKYMHTVITGQCTGCELCIAPCPVNCISMEIAELPLWHSLDAEQSRKRHQAKNRRIAKQEEEKKAKLYKQKQQLDKLKKLNSAFNRGYP